MTGRPTWLGAVVAAVAALGVALTGVARISATPPSRDVQPIFLGYVYELPEDIRHERYTHLCHAFILADEAGNLQANKHVPNRKLAREAHAAGVKVLLSLGGWGWDKQFAAMAADADAQRRYVAAVMRLVDEYDYDGVDLDWEYPDSAEEATGFERLAHTLRTRMDEFGRQRGRPMLLTMAASGSPHTLKWLRTEFLLETMDWINVMTYDYAGDESPLAAHHSPLFASKKLPADAAVSTELTMKYLVDQRRMPPDRLAVGLPLYGRGFNVAEPYAPTAGAARDPVGGNYARLHELQSKQGWTRQWDDETKNPWLHSPDGTSIVGYDDAQSLALRTAWAMKQGFRGVFFWQIAGDRLPDGGNPLQEAAHRAWKRAVSERSK